MFAKVNATSLDGEETTLVRAAKHCSAEIVEYLIQQGAKVNVRNAKPVNSPPLTAAIMWKREDNAKVLLEYGADPTARDIANFTALDHAMIMGWPEMAARISAATAEWELRIASGKCCFIAR